MSPRILLLLSLGTLVLVGCQNQNQEPAAHGEEPYTPSYTSLDAMDATTVADTETAYEPPPAEPAVDTGTVEPADQNADEPLAPVGGQVYTVQKGDTLYELARRFYNDQSRWREIWQANENRVSDPNKLQVGMKLIIP